MARTAKSPELLTRTARLRLAPRGRPYFARSGKDGVLIGYRRTESKNGKWCVKTHRGTQRGGAIYRLETVAEADDYADADGFAILTYYQAMDKVGARLSPAQQSAHYTVNRAIADYIDHLKRHKDDARARDAELRLKSYLGKKLGDKLVAHLTRDDFADWLDWAQTHRPKGRAKKARAIGRDEESKRRKRATLNRVIANVKACLNRCVESQKAPSTDAWRYLKKFRKADQARTSWLTQEQGRSLWQKSLSPDFARIARGALLTGARWGELRRMRVGDFNAVAQTVLIADSKSGMPRQVYLSRAHALIFAEWCKDREPQSYLFTDRGGQWPEQNQKRAMVAACTAAEISPTVGFHALRHTYASALVQAGTSLKIVADNLGHTTTRMVEKHYGHLAESHRRDAIEAAQLDF